MPTRWRFVCHVHCLVHDGAVRSSPCRPHHENFGRNLYHMFVPAYSASQPFVFVLSCGIRVASKSNVDSIPFLSGALIFLCGYQSFLIIEMVMSILFPTGVFSLQVDPIISTSARSIIIFLNGVCFIRLQVAFVFPALPPLFFFKDSNFLNQVSFYSCEVSPFSSINIRIRCFSWRY